ncbi:MAG TPA: hypothetical protein VJ486_12625 [Geothrix sp.]|nr:hypothetical protein [Geothrix sp.]
MAQSLSRLLRKEQFAFLGRNRAGWGSHLEHVRAFLGEGLQSADPVRPVLVLGAGPGLEVPWALAPPLTTGWDADPWSRAWTFLRHRRWAPWVYGDLTGGLADLEATALRCAMETWSRRRRDPQVAARRLAGLLPSLNPDPAALRHWLQQHHPGTILAANVMGQFGVVAQRLVEGILGTVEEPDPDRQDPVAEALEAWTARAIKAFLKVLQESGADLWLVHDRAVVFSGGGLALGPWRNDWTQQLEPERLPLEAQDPLAGQDVVVLLGQPSALRRKERWIWDLAPSQRHLVEALAWLPGNR